MNPVDKFSRARIAVVGAGAVGCYYGGRLAEAGGDVHFLMRSDLGQVKRAGLKVRSALGDFHLRHDEIRCYGHPEEIGPVDLVLIAVKTTANADLPGLLPPLLHRDTVLLTLQNGLGNEEFLADHFGGERVMGGLCFVCLNRTAPGEILHIGEGRVRLGEFDHGDGGHPGARARGIAAEFERSGVACTVVEDLANERWRKLVWNIPFNGLSIVAGGVDTATITADEDLTSLARQLMGEIIAVAHLLGHEIPESFADRMLEVTRSMGAYRPSSMIDFLEGHAVEVESIWGEPLRRARKAGFDAGRLELLYLLMRHLVASRDATD